MLREKLQHCLSTRCNLSFVWWLRRGSRELDGRTRNEKVLQGTAQSLAAHVYHQTFHAHVEKVLALCLGLFYLLAADFVFLKNLEIIFLLPYSTLFKAPVPPAAKHSHIQTSMSDSLSGVCGIKGHTFAPLHMLRLTDQTTYFFCLICSQRFFFFSSKLQLTFKLLCLSVHTDLKQSADTDAWISTVSS